jgi:hypothetical protein
MFHIEVVHLVQVGMIIIQVVLSSSISIKIPHQLIINKLRDLQKQTSLRVSTKQITLFLFLHLMKDFAALHLVVAYPSILNSRYTN